jgi:hypothetical protein
MEDGRMQGQWVVTYRNGKSYPYEYLDDEMVQDFSGTRTSLPSNYTAKSGTVRMPFCCSPGRCPDPLSPSLSNLSRIVDPGAATPSVTGVRRPPDRS